MEIHDYSASQAAREIYNDVIVIAVVNALLDRLVFGSLEWRFVARWKR